MAKKRKVKRKLSPLGKFCVFLLIFLVLILMISRCAVNKRSKQIFDNTNKSVSSNSGNYSLDESMFMKYAKRTNATNTLNIKSKYGILINIDDNTIVAEKGGDKKIFPTSLTKIMTLVLAVENIKDFEQTYTFKTETIDPLVMEDASRAGFESGETVTINDILYGSILPSGADATIALAEIVAGSELEFVKLMNYKANELGLKNTHFMNTSGLHDENHYSTPHEMALITKYAMKNKTCAKILSAIEYTTSKTVQHPNGIELYSTMFSRMYGDEAETVTIKAGKTGYTTEGGNCLASYAEKDNGEKFILVTTDAEGQYTPIYDAIDAYAKQVGNGKKNIRPEIPTEQSYY